MYPKLLWPVISSEYLDLVANSASVRLITYRTYTLYQLFVGYRLRRKYAVVMDQTVRSVLKVIYSVFFLNERKVADLL